MRVRACRSGLWYAEVIADQERFSALAQWAWPNIALGVRLHVADEHGRIRPNVTVEFLALTLSVGWW